MPGQKSGPDYVLCGIHYILPLIMNKITSNDQGDVFDEMIRSLLWFINDPVPGRKSRPNYVLCGICYILPLILDKITFSDQSDVFD